MRDTQWQPDRQVVIRRATGDDWRLLRAVRLEALQDAPLAFASTHEREVSFTEDAWRARTRTAAVFLAVAAGDTVGTATAFVDPAHPATTRLVAMYVVPAARGQRVAERLVAAVLELARAEGHDRVALDVVATNHPARRAYERCGFVPTGVTSSLPHAPELTEIELQLLLR